jgi:hypothetical protein
MEVTLKNIGPIDEASIGSTNSEKTNLPFAIYSVTKNKVPKEMPVLCS